MGQFYALISPPGGSVLRAHFHATHWSTRTLAEAVGTNRSLVNRVWRAHGLKPHLCHTFKVSNDPCFAEKLIDVVGLYLDPPEHALVLCVDEKSQIQALDRTQKSLPIYPGRSETEVTHDYKRNGTTTLFAAADMLEGQRSGGTCRGTAIKSSSNSSSRSMPRRRRDWTPHLIVDNYATHKHPKVQAWLRRYERFNSTSSRPAVRG